MAKERSCFGLPVLKMFVLCSIQATEGIMSTQVIAYLPFLVQDLLRTDADDVRIGTYNGLLNATFSIAQVLTAHMWGYLSDRVGRRPVLIIGLIGNCVTIPAFGFATTLWMAFLCRALQGFFNGNLGVVMTYLHEITTKDNQARGFSMIGLAYATGLSIGPMLGGVLYEKYLFGLTQFPQLVSCLACATISFIALIIAAFVLTETYDPRANVPKHDIPPDIEAEDSTRLSDPLWSKHRKPRGVKPIQRAHVSPYREVLRLRPFLYATLMYMFTGYAFLSQTTVYPLWAKATYEWNATQIGSITTFGLIAVVIVQLFLYHRFVKLFGMLRIYQGAIWIMVFMSLLWPLLGRITVFDVQYGAMIAVYLILTSSSSFVFTACKQTIPNTVYQEVLGTGNGIAQAMASLARAVGPAMGGYLFSVGQQLETRGGTISKVPYMNQYLPFLIQAVFAMIGCFVSTRIPLKFNFPDRTKRRAEYEFETTRTKEELKSYYTEFSLQRRRISLLSFTSQPQKYMAARRPHR